MSYIYIYNVFYIIKYPQYRYKKYILIFILYLYYIYILCHIDKYGDLCLEKIFLFALFCKKIDNNLKCYKPQK